MKTTKQLACELGLIRKRRSTLLKTQAQGKRRKKNEQVFSYLIVVDFESTCWENKRNTSNEIIEFPAVLLNTETGDIEDEFQFYVQPIENPTLSEFCRTLTGITQEQVDDGIPLSLCLKKFTSWLNKLSTEKGITFGSGDRQCCFVTWSDWDIGTCLFYECRRKQLRIPSSMNSWTDLRATYRRFYERKPNGLNGALQDVGIEFEGRQHSGLDDAKNTAKLTWKMICDGCIIQITKSLTMPTAVSVIGTIKPATSLRDQQQNQPPIHVQKKCVSRPHNSSVAEEDAREVKVGIKDNAASGHNLHSRVRQTFFNIKQTIRTSESQISGEPSSVSSALPTDHPVLVRNVSTVVSGRSNLVNQSTGGLTTPCEEHNFTKLKTPLSTAMNVFSSVSMNGAFKPSDHNYKTSLTNIKHSITPPLCGCGRRTKRKYVQSPGPNLGRCFYSCCIGRRSYLGESKKVGCGFFKWEVDIMSHSKMHLTRTGATSISRRQYVIGNLTNLPQPNFDLTLSVKK